jgi:hypothetical protein
MWPNCFSQAACGCFEPLVWLTAKRISQFHILQMDYNIKKICCIKRMYLCNLYLFTAHKLLKISTQNYWVFGLCPLSSILETRNCNVSETGSVSGLRWREKTPTQLGPLERANLNHPQVNGKTPTELGPLERANLNHWVETDPVSETLCFLVSRIPNNGQSPRAR